MTNKQSKEWIDEIMVHSKSAVLVFVDGKLCEGIYQMIDDENSIVYTGSEYGVEKEKEIKILKTLIEKSGREILR